MSDTLIDYGVLPTGFNRMRLPEIRLAIIEELQNKTGLTFETRPDTITGQFIDTFAEREATLWELSEAVYHAMYPVSAFGTNLDHAVSFSGVRRLFEKSSTAWAILYGVNGTLVPAGVTIRQSSTQELFTLTDPVLIDTNALLDVTLAIDTVADGDVFSVRINTVTYSYTAILADTTISVAANLAILLAASGQEVVSDANEVRIYTIEFATFSLLVSANVTILEIGSGGDFIAQETGPIEVTTGTLNTIITTAVGWTRVNNIVPGQTGRNDETDDELRRRYASGVFRLGAATVEAIYANLLQNVAGILALRVFENVEDVVDAEGRSPHSIEVIALGGDARELAQEIFLLKAAGIDTFGSIPNVVTDSNGFLHNINFNRPETIYVWVDVKVFLYDEEIFPSTGEILIDRIIVETGNSFGIGKDVIIQRFLGPIYAQVAGIQQLDITIYATTDPTYIPTPGDYVDTTIAIADRELSRFDGSRVAVTVIP